ncbi:hypothetical protein Vi05172_g10861 [Venturia inaequalis]|nr:hypothetical protein Vi05172_g10861 [Venturia inaequalis]
MRYVQRFFLVATTVSRPAMIPVSVLCAKSSTAASLISRPRPSHQIQAPTTGKELPHGSTNFSKNSRMGKSPCRRMPKPLESSDLSADNWKGATTRLDEFLEEQQNGQVAMSSYAEATRGSRQNIATTTNRTKPAAHPRHPVAPKYSETKSSRAKPLGSLENAVKRMSFPRVSKKPVDPAEPAEPVDTSNGLLIDFS